MATPSQIEANRASAQLKFRSVVTGRQRQALAQRPDNRPYWPAPSSCQPMMLPPIKISFLSSTRKFEPPTADEETLLVQSIADTEWPLLRIPLPTLRKIRRRTIGIVKVCRVCPRTAHAHVGWPQSGSQHSWCGTCLTNLSLVFKSNRPSRRRSPNPPGQAKPRLRHQLPRSAPLSSPRPPNESGNSLCWPPFPLDLAVNDSFIRHGRERCDDTGVASAKVVIIARTELDIAVTLDG